MTIEFSFGMQELGIYVFQIDHNVKIKSLDTIFSWIFDNIWIYEISYLNLKAVKKQSILITSEL